MNIHESVVRKNFVYTRVGHDKRSIKLLSEGKIGRGSARWEMFWDLQEKDGQRLLNFYDDMKELTCFFHLCADGIWRGHWRKHNERMAVLLSPGNAEVLLIQQADSYCGEMLELTSKHHLSYARSHDTDFWCLMGRVQFERPAVWDKIILFQQALKRDYDLIVWVDADALIVNPTIDLRESLSEFACIGMCKHNGPWRQQSWHFNAGVVFVRVCDLAREFFEAVWKAGPTTEAWQEQARMLECIERYPDAVQAIDNKWNTHPCSPSETPVIKAWHGFPGDRVPLMKEELDLIQ